LIQAVLFSHIVAVYDGSPVSCNELSHSLRCNKIKLLQYADDFKELERKKLIQSAKKNIHWGDRKASHYRIPQEVTDSLLKDEEYIPASYTDLSLNAFFARIEELFEQRLEHDEIFYDELSSEIVTLIEDNKNLAFVKNIKAFSINSRY
jgi:hypothetical protein